MYMHLPRAAQLAVVGSIMLVSGLVSRIATARDMSHSVPVAATASSAPSAVERVGRAPTPAPTAIWSERAAALHEWALAMQLGGRVREAAALHRASAALRPADDSSAVACLESAGTLMADAGDFTEARASMRAAAARALARGDTAHAAESTLLAGFVARAQGDAAGVAAYAREARRLANAPSVPAARRAAILSRIR